MTYNMSANYKAFWGGDQLKLQSQTVNRAEWRMARGTVQVYHSSDPINAEMLVRYRVGTYTPQTGYENNYPTQTVLVPRRHGTTDEVLRCAIAHCAMCELTQHDLTDLTLSIAKDHNIHGVYICPTPRYTAAARLADGVARGEWMHKGTKLNVPDRTLSKVQMHDGAWQFQSVMHWLYEIPFITEQQDSRLPLNLAMMMPMSMKSAHYSPPSALDGELAVGSDCESFAVIRY